MLANEHGKLIAVVAILYISLLFLRPSVRPSVSLPPPLQFSHGSGGIEGIFSTHPFLLLLLGAKCGSCGVGNKKYNQVQLLDIDYLPPSFGTKPEFVSGC